MENKRKNRIEDVKNWEEAESRIAKCMNSQRLASSVIKQARDQARRWCILWLITFVALIATNIAWLIIT